MSTDETNKKFVKLIPEEIHQRVQHQNLLAREKADEDAKKNHGFVQVEKRNFRELRGLIDRSPVAAKLLLIIGEKMNRQNALLCSFNTLKEITGLSRSTLSVAVALLKKECWLEVVKIGTANAYIVNSRVFWQSYGNMKHATFNATIVASSTEQDKENWNAVDLRHFPFLTSDQEEKPEEKLIKPTAKDDRQIDLLDDSQL